MQRKRMVLPLLAIVLVLALLTACGGTQDNPGNTPQDAQPDNQPSENAQTPTDEPAEASPAEDTGDAVVFSPFEYEKLDPAVAGEGDEDLLAVSSMVYDTLVDVVDGEIVAGLAAEWSVSDDGLTYRFTLRPDAVFSDGTPVTTDVVMANFNRWYYPDNALHGDDSSVYQAWLANFKGFWTEPKEDTPPESLFDGIEKSDELNFLIHLYEPMDNFLEVISMPQFSILHPTLLADVGYGTMLGDVVGTGAYVVDTWDETGLTLVPSSTYWGQ